MVVVALRIATIMCVMGRIEVISIGRDGLPLLSVNATIAFSQQQPNLATESRRNHFPQYANNYVQYHPDYRPQTYPYPTNIRPNGLSPFRPQYSPNQLYGTQHRPRPTAHYPSNQYANTRPGIMQALESISANDNLHCVPKILCEMTAGISRRNGQKQSSSASSMFPFNFINSDSVMSLLSFVDDRSASPLYKLGKAVLLGYSSRNTGSCQYAYPKCPDDPDRLLFYLNNHNGGFFRFFNGLQAPSFYQPNSQVFQRRIQTNLNNDITSETFDFYDYNENKDKRQYGWIFPTSYYTDDAEKYNYENDDSRGDEELALFYRGNGGKSVKFPNGENIQSKPVYTQTLLPFHFPDSTRTNYIKWI